jgi:hypothetical protein
MNAQSDTLRRAMEALESVCTKPNAEHAGDAEGAIVPSVSEPELPEPSRDPAEWRDHFRRWVQVDCVSHWRLHGGVSGLHIAFCEWAVKRGEVPCSRSVFESLLREFGWAIHPTLALVEGLMLRRSLGMSGNHPEFLEREFR